MKIFQRGGQVVVAGFGNENVYLFDMLGHSLAVSKKGEAINTVPESHNSVSFDVPAS